MRLSKPAFIKATILLLVTLIGLAAIHIMTPVRTTLEPLSCHSHFLLTNENAPENSTDLFANFIFGKGILIVRLEGELRSSDANTASESISRIIKFNYRTVGSNLIMKTHSIIKSYADNADDDKLRSLLPGFYLEKDYSGRIYLYPTNTGDYIISTGKVPSFICQAE